MVPFATTNTANADRTRDPPPNDRGLVPQLIPQHSCCERNQAQGPARSTRPTGDLLQLHRVRHYPFLPGGGDEASSDAVGAAHPNSPTGSSPDGARAVARL